MLTQKQIDSPLLRKRQANARHRRFYSLIIGHHASSDRDRRGEARDGRLAIIKAAAKENDQSETIGG